MRKFFVAAAVAVAALFASAAQADAAFAVRFASGANSLLITDGTVQDGNVGDTTRITVNASDAAVLAFQAASGFTITGTTFSFRNGTGAGGTSILSESHTEVERTLAGSATLTITVGYDGFTLPTGAPLPVNSTVGFSAIQPTSGNISFQFQNWVSNVPPAQDLTNPVGVVQTTGLVNYTSVIPPGSVPSLLTPQTLFNRTTPAFQVTERSTITMNQNDFVSFTATTVVSQTPAPAGLVLALTGMPVLGVGAWVRRRMTRAAV